jgi:hypothetical protein
VATINTLAVKDRRDEQAVIAESTSGDSALVAAVTGERYRVKALAISCAGTVNAKFRSGTTDKTGLFYGVANTQVVLPYNPAGWFETDAGEALNINLSAAVAVGGQIVYERIS